MSLIIPGVGTEAGPTWATDLNTSLSIIDQHNHTAGSGVQITPAAININSALSLANNFAIAAAGITFTVQNSTPANNTVYESGVDLYYVDGLGNNVQITANGGVAGSPGSISNLTSPASAAYVAGSKTFVWQSDVGIAANLDAGALRLRNITPNSTYAITLQAPSALSSNYNVVLPALPASTSLMALDSSGNVSAPYSIAGGLNASVLTAQSITATQIANATITGTQIASSIALAGSPTIAGKVTTIGGNYPVVANTNATAALAMIRGAVDGTGSITNGEGFTAVRASTGVFNLTWDVAFSDAPVIVAVCGTFVGNSGIAKAQASTTTTGQIIMQNTSSSPANFPFTFIAIGQRA